MPLPRPERPGAEPSPGAAWRWTPAALVISVLLVAQFARIGSDWEWVVAIGDHVRATWEVPSSVPFAAAPTEGWHDVPVLAQLVASYLAGGGPTLMVAWHVLTVVVTLLLLVLAARQRGGRDGVVAIMLTVLLLGTLQWWVILRLQTFSLPLFALLLLVLVRQAQRPDRGIWWVVPLVAVWGNLHGAVLMGTCVLGAYLLADRLRQRPAETVAVGSLSLVALLATPQGLDTLAYYRSVFDNVAAERGLGLWAPLDLGSPLDVLLIIAAAVLGVLVLRRRRAAWEYVAVLGLAVATSTASRHGLWLLVLMFVVAASPSTRTDTAQGHGPLPAWWQTAWPAAVAGCLATVLVLVRGDAVAAVDPDVVATVSDVAAGESGRDGGAAVVLAQSPMVESLAAAGVRVWVSNPIDAFSPEDQGAYLDFLEGGPGMSRAVAGAEVVVTSDDGAAHERMGTTPGFSARPCGDAWTCWTRD